MKVVVSHPTGNANLRNVLRALQDANFLGSFHTTIAVFRQTFWGSLSQMPGCGVLKRRQYSDALREITKTHSKREAVRLLAIRLGISDLVNDEHAWASIDSVAGELDGFVASAVSQGAQNAVYCYEDAALNTFITAKALGQICFYDLPIGYWRAAQRFLREEAERRPEWIATMDGLRDTREKLDRKDSELLLADRILVASSFTKQTLTECPNEVAPVSVIPYGADDSWLQGATIRGVGTAQRLRVLFVGALSQRKGIAYLFDAVNLLKACADLTIIGRKVGRSCPALDAALANHRWIESLRREQILAEMRQHDVLVFPSLFEGFGLVITEALSQGVPVITTPHTCGPDVLADGEDGFIVPIRDPQAISEKLELLHRDRDLLNAMSDAARRKAELLTWESYRRGIVAVVREALAA